MEETDQLHAPAALPRGKSLQYTLDRKLGELQNRSRRCGEEKNLYRESNLGRPAVAIPTQLPLLSVYASDFKVFVYVVSTLILYSRTMFTSNYSISSLSWFMFYII
jgi:hypothetical protein